MNGKKEPPAYLRIAMVIMDEKTFDVSRNEDELRTVYQMIAKKMCEGLSFARIIESYGQYCHLVKQNLDHAILYLQEEMKIPVYRRIEPQQEITTSTGNTVKKGGKFIEYLTIDVEYRDAREDEIDRISSLVRKSLGSAQRNLGIAAPRKSFESLVSKELKQIDKKEEKDREEKDKVEEKMSIEKK